MKLGRHDKMFLADFSRLRLLLQKYRKNPCIHIRIFIPVIVLLNAHQFITNKPQKALICPMKTAHQIFSVIMAFVLLVSTSGFSYAEHTCHKSGHFLIQLNFDDNSAHCACEIHHHDTFAENSEDLSTVSPAPCCTEQISLFKTFSFSDDVKTKKGKVVAQSVKDSFLMTFSYPVFFIYDLLITKEVPIPLLKASFQSLSSNFRL